MSILVFGFTGQLAQSLRDTKPDCDQLDFVARDQCDLAEVGQVNAILEQYKPEFIINSAAYTSVDRAEEESELAHLVNRRAIQAMAVHVHEHDAKLIHVSTDFVFDGAKTSPYQPGEPTGPLGVYGSSKLAGELVALKAAPESTMIIRTSWLYSEYGNNFVKTMLRLMAERDELGVVDDQLGSPTYARGFAESVWQIVNDELFSPGIYHWTDAGGISWYEFAVAIQEEAREIGLLKGGIPIKGIGTSDYPTLAERPAYSVLDNGKLAKLIGTAPIPWRDNLKRMLLRLAG